MQQLAEIKARVETTEELPPMPQIWLRIREMTERFNVSAQEVAGLILKDQGTTSKLLKVANSAIYAGYHQKITTVTNAIVLLGFNEVRNIVLGYAVYNMLGKLKKNKKFDFKAFWIHSLATGVAARMLAESLQYQNTEEAFVAGFLHDIGKLVSGQLFPEAYNAAQAKIKRGEKPLQCERETIGADHQQVGKWVASRWHFPELLVDAIALHHHLENRNAPQRRKVLVRIVAVANDMAKLIFSKDQKASKETARAFHSRAFALLNISRERWALILRNLSANVKDVLEEFNLNQIDLDAYTEQLDRLSVEQIQTENLYREMNQELTSKVKELTVLNEFSTALLQTADPAEVKNLLIEAVYRAVNFSRVLLFLPDEEKTFLQAGDGFGANIEGLLGRARVPLTDKGAIVTSYKQGRLINILNAASNLYSGMVSQHELNLLRCASFGCVPIMMGQKAFGVLVVDNHIPAEPIPDQRIQAVVTFANQASLVLQRAA